MKRVRFLSAAEDEMLEAAFYYEQQSQGLGKDYLDNVRHAVDDISQHPTRWPNVRAGIRRRMVHRFPFAVLYEDRASEVVVVAIMHLHRHPNYWIDRSQ